MRLLRAALSAWCSLTIAPHILVSQSAAMSGSPLPGAHRMSVLRLDLSRSPQFTRTERQWVPSLGADAAIANSLTRVGLGLARFPSSSAGQPSRLGAEAAVTHVFLDADPSRWFVWGNAAVGAVSLANEGLDGKALDVMLGGGVGWVFTPPGVGELGLLLAPRFQYRHLDTTDQLEHNPVGGGATVALDWASQCRPGAFAAFDVEWLSHRPPGDRRVQTAIRLGISYRLLLFRYHGRLPPDEDAR